MNSVVRARLKEAVPFRVLAALRSLKGGQRLIDVARMLGSQERNLAWSLARLQERMSVERDLDDMIETAFHFAGRGRYRSIKPQQSKMEIRTLLEMVAARRPRTILEIGTGRGGTLYLYCRYLSSALRIITVDLPQSTRSQWDNSRLWRQFSDRAELIFLSGDSHSDEMHARVRRHLPGGADFVFIDGDHSYAGVKADFFAYKDMVTPGGLLALHDVNMPEGGVLEFWNGIAGAYESGVIIAREARPPGIGWVRL